MRRRIFSALCFGTAVGAVALFAQAAFAGGISALGVGLTLCFAATLPWGIVNFWNGAVGAALRLRHARPEAVVFPEIDAPAPAASGGRIVAAMLIRHEEVEGVFRRLRAMAASFDAAGLGERIDFAVLSDSSDPATAAAEEAAFAACRAQDARPARWSYRRRERNTGKKTGNLWDFLRRRGWRYEQMLILDADSLMDGATVARMAGVMDANPQLGLLQSLVVATPARSLFARLGQFGMRHGLRSFTLGAAWWQGDAGPYWGHNALVRIAPFMAHCRLPDLPDGRWARAWRGEIASHDLLEAVLLRRAGWGVRVLPVEGGSYEDHPPRWSDHISRDLRWCRGNLQYLLLPRLGLDAVGRTHLLMAAAMYVGGPAWIGFAALSALGALTGTAGAIAALAWPVFTLIVALVFAPKLLSLLATAFGPEARRWGGRWATLRGGAAEAVFAMLAAPATAAAQTVFILSSAATGRAAGWPAQNRTARGECEDALRNRAAPIALLGGIFALGFFALGPVALAWSAPLWLGLALTPALAWASAHPRVGAAAQAMRLAATPEERRPSPLLRAVGFMPLRRGAPARTRRRPLLAAAWTER